MRQNATAPTARNNVVTADADNNPHVNTNDVFANSLPTTTQSSSHKPSLQTRRPIQLIPAFFLAILFIHLQLYIGSTFAGTRPRRAGLPFIYTEHSISPSRDAWDQCARLISTGLRDAGDAGRIWLKHAFVGTQPQDQISVDRFNCRCLLPQVYSGKQPRMTAIVQSFNHHNNIRNISDGLKQAKYIDEIVISEDGSTDGSLHDWHDALKGPTNFIIRSNNLHELRSYNRAMRMSAGDIVLLLQDDDLLPISDEWVQNAQKLFDALPDLGVLGGYIGQLWNHSSNQGFEFGEQISTHGGMRQGKTQPLKYIEPKTGLPFMYAECVWIAPVFIRRSLLRKAGGLELTIAKRGEPGVWQDCVFSYEAWVNGFTVGTYNAPFERGVGGHGSASSPLKVKQRERVFERAVAYTNRKYPRRRIHESIVRTNEETLKKRYLK